MSIYEIFAKHLTLCQSGVYLKKAENMVKLDHSHNVVNNVCPKREILNVCQEQLYSQNSYTRHKIYKVPRQSVGNPTEKR